MYRYSRVQLYKLSSAHLSEVALSRGQLREVKLRGLERRLGASQDSHRSPPDAARTLPKTRPGRLQTRIKRGKTPEPVGTRSSREYAPNTLPKINVDSLPEILIELSWLSHYPSSVTLSILTLLVPFFRPAPTYSDQGSLGLQVITYVKFQLL